jgi:hypothetical protein
MLDLNHPELQRVRARYCHLLGLYRDNPNHPIIRSLYLDAFGFPDDLPNLKEKRPESNTRPEGVNDCYFQQRLEGRLPEVYGVEMLV